MTDWVTWFRYQLQASADGFILNGKGFVPVDILPTELGV